MEEKKERMEYNQLKLADNFECVQHDHTESTESALQESFQRNKTGGKLLWKYKYR